MSPIILLIINITNPIPIIGNNNLNPNVINIPKILKIPPIIVPIIPTIIIPSHVIKPNPPTRANKINPPIKTIPKMLAIFILNSSLLIY